ncbi:hypothetical protein CTAYLR_006151 [Chrysophaeum taylorii]|uniref:Phosphoglycerate mutase n=1 Tax=Chrysophaeum taylorii TaxID=2483200 RepID=A0AAD7UNC6_9STRA|nr:hypothetical protein CTAYLR_006151 [Chrysophaeum taylorii]
MRRSLVPILLFLGVVVGLVPPVVVQRRCEVRRPVSYVEDDGFSVRYEQLGKKKNERWRTELLLKNRKKKPGSLILVRHGESLWNENSTFSGWADPDLAARGEREIEHSARLLLAAGYSVDVAYTSRLKRAIRSTWILLRELDQIYRPVYKSWRLNERCYGALTGLSKPGLALEKGETQVQSWRHGLLDVPPPLTRDHAYYPGKERKYADLPEEMIPLSESLQDTMERTLPLWNSRILDDLLEGKNVLLVAHGNSLRGIVKHIDRISDEAIVNVSIPNAIPLVYEFDRVFADGRSGLAPRRVESKDSVADPVLRGNFLEKKGLLRTALARESELKRKIPGFESESGPLSPALRALAKLELERKLMELAGDSRALEHTTAASTHDASYMMGLNEEEPRDAAAAVHHHHHYHYHPESSEAMEDEGPMIVIVRHGKTTHNQLGLFTGWEDVGLAKQGREEATSAGKLLRRHGIELDVVYTSWLSRAIETAWIMLEQLDCLWIPIIKTWRLNERMYGGLTGLSKKMIAQKHGEAKFKKWRRGYAERPPKTSTFSHHYPGNDERYVKYVQDIDISFRETLVRTLAEGRITVARNFPKSESLKDCMDRTIPYYVDVIEPLVVEQQRNVLIASSENAIRGLLMHLCEIPPDRISDVEIPTGLPLIYSLSQKCLKLLDDGNFGGYDNPIDRYDFGKAAELLFKPCDPTRGGTCQMDADGQPSQDPIIRLKPAIPRQAAAKEDLQAADLAYSSSFL